MARYPRPQALNKRRDPTRKDLRGRATDGLNGEWPLIQRPKNQNQIKQAPRKVMQLRQVLHQSHGHQTPTHSNPRSPAKPESQSAPNVSVGPGMTVATTLKS